MPAEVPFAGRKSTTHRIGTPAAAVAGVETKKKPFARGVPARFIDTDATAEATPSSATSGLPCA